VQSAHIQDLQHHLNVKTWALQTLQREYDSLFRELEQHRTKLSSIESKLATSTVELSNQTEMKDQLHAQIASLESQVDELQKGRDEARRQSVANGAQYMRIMDMANRLQAQGLEDQKRWEGEKRELEGRIRILEEAMVTGQSVDAEMDNVDDGTDAGADAGGDKEGDNLPPCSQPENFNAHSAPFAASAKAASEMVSVLRAEVGRLRKRTKELEDALRGVKEDGAQVQEVARRLLEVGGRMEKGTGDTLRGQ
jgi:predicted nuclease with TOPRIM domain